MIPLVAASEEGKAQNRILQRKLLGNVVFGYVTYGTLELS